MQNRKNIEKVCFIGPPKVGKTHLFHYLNGQKYFRPYHTTVNVDFHTKFCTKGTIQYWDFPYESAFHYLKGTHHAILVFNRGDRDTFDLLPAYLNAIKKYAPNAVVSLVGTSNEYTGFDESLEDEIHIFCTRHGLEHLPLVTTSDASMNTLFEHILLVKKDCEDLNLSGSPVLSTASSFSKNRISPDSITGRLTDSFRSFFKKSHHAPNAAAHQSVIPILDQR